MPSRRCRSGVLEPRRSANRLLLLAPPPLQGVPSLVLASPSWIGIGGEAVVGPFGQSRRSDAGIVHTRRYESSGGESAVDHPGIGAEKCTH